MKSEGFLIFLRAALLVAAATVMSQPVLAQQPLFLLELPASEHGTDPIAFMRPHFFVHPAAGMALSNPPSSAFVPSQIRHAYGFDQVPNQGAAQFMRTRNPKGTPVFSATNLDCQPAPLATVASPRFTNPAASLRPTRIGPLKS